ncbi:MAG: imidazole glycerol phosphate synthase subunit HisH [Actinobacteria bacterium]|nr:imidazole glycerol phosphate synthase subunit HisH [Actinomycetota bacterium]
MYIAIINYNMGNIKSVENAFKIIGAQVKVTSSPSVIRKAEAVVLPGVGAFQDAVNNLKQLKLYDSVIEVTGSGKPFLGICIGLQVLFEYGKEGGISDGLGIFKGSVERILPGVKIPHMGWNKIKIAKVKSLLFKDIKDGESFYFVHSYHVVCDDESLVSSLTEYGVNIVSSIEYKNIYGLQFHPEKSSRSGLQILKNFASIAGM